MPAREYSFSVIQFDDFSKHVKRYGNFCGPGWSAGKETSNISYEQIIAAPVKQIPDGFGGTKDSPLDGACQGHDGAYALAKGKPNEANLVLRADKDFIIQISERFSSMPLEEKKYSVLAVAAFSAKIKYYDEPKAMLEVLRNLISTMESDPDIGKTAFEIEDNGITYSAMVTDGKIVATRDTGNELLSINIDANNNAIDLVAQQLDDSGLAYDETTIHTDLDANRSILSHATDGVEDLQGIIIGKVTQDKLDQFVGLGLAAADPDSGSDSAQNDTADADGAVSTLLTSMNVNISNEARDALDTWFAESNPIVLEPFRWETVDANLQAFWRYGNEQVMPAYDLGSALDDAGFDPGMPDWTPPDLNPLFSDLAHDNANQVTTPIFTGPQQSSSFWSSFSSPTSSLAGSGPFNSYNSSAYTSDRIFNSYIDPLVVKLGWGHVHTTNLYGSNVMFDMNGDGLKERTGWITADEGFLVLDKNGNGKVDDIREMFSELMSPSARTGFAALAEFDANRDGSIDYKDPISKQLQLWIDINCNGVTDQGELHGLTEFNLTNILLRRAGSSSGSYDNGNLITDVRSYVAGIENGFAIREIAEVLFNFGESAPVDTIYIADQFTAVRTESGKAIEVLTDKNKQIVNASLSGVNVLVGGAGDILNAGNAGQSILIGNGKTTMNGNAGDVHFIVNGSGNIVNTGSGSSWIEVHGDANTINAARGDVTLEVDGDRNRITIGSGADVTLGGVANTLTAVAKSHDNTILVTGINEVVIASAADIVIDEAASLTLRGKNNDITMTGNATLAGNASGGTLTVSGENNVATLSASFIAMTEGSGLTLTGGSHQVVMGGDASLTMKSSGAGSTIVVTGDDNQLNASRATVILADGAGLDLNGSADRIILFDDADVLATGTAHRIDVYGTGNEVTANRSTVLEHAFAELDLSGTGNLLRVTPENSPAVKAELAAERALHLQMEKALDKFVELAGPMPGTVTPVEVSTVGTLSLAGSASVLPGSEILH